MADNLFYLTNVDVCYMSVTEFMMVVVGEPDMNS
jgi:hypothetical protein